MNHIIAIDPGLSGGIAWRDVDGNAHCIGMPDTEGSIKDVLFKLTHDNFRTTVFIERAPSAMPGQVAGLAKLNANAGFIRGICMARGLILNVIQPMAWQKPLALGTRSACKNSGEWKGKLKGKAQQLFPHTEGITLKTCDALLILHHATTTI